MNLTLVILFVCCACGVLSQSEPLSLKATARIASTRKYLTQSRTFIDSVTFDAFFHNATQLDYDDETVEVIRALLTSTASRRGEPIYSSLNDTIVLEFFDDPLDVRYQRDASIWDNFELIKRYASGSILEPIKEVLVKVGLDRLHQEWATDSIKELYLFVKAQFTDAFSHISDHMGWLYGGLDDVLFNSDEEFVMVFEDGITWDILIEGKRPINLTKEVLTDRTANALYEYILELMDSSVFSTCINLVDDNGHFRATIKMTQLGKSSKTFKNTVCDSDWVSLYRLKISFE